MTTTATLPPNVKVQPSALDLVQLSAIELVALLASGQVSAMQAVEAHIARIEQVNPKLNAVVVKRYDAARAEARQADEKRARGEVLGPLHGLPIAIKESLDLQGTPSTFGLTWRAKILATQNDVYVQRLKDAGAIILGKTNVAQLLFYFESNNPVYGQTKNPWNLNRTPGGSSGGQAAILATGGAALGIGTDLGGSLRVPATFCGIASLKPTAGRLPDVGRYSMPIGQRAIVSQVGPMARNVADVALGLEVLNGGRNPQAEPPMPLGDYRKVDVSQLRVAFYTDDGTFKVAPAVARAVREAAEGLKRLGAQVTEWTPPNVNAALDIAYGVFGSDGTHSLRATLKGEKAEPAVASLTTMGSKSRTFIRALGTLLNTVGQKGLASGIRTFGYQDTQHYWGLVEAQMDYQRQFMEALDKGAGGPFDIILCPANALPAWTHGASRDLITAGAYSILYNVLGYPAGVVPFTRVQAAEAVGRAASKDMVEQVALKTEQDSAGLPVGVQVVARPWREHVALAAMLALEGLARQREDYVAFPKI
jgi:fatty acid amide hydrolase